MKTKHFFLACILTFVGSSFIIIRHDIDDQKYLDYGKNGGFESLASFSDGNGTLIDEQWVITARHVADDQRPGHPVTINGVEYKVAKVVLYPQVLDPDLLKRQDVGIVMLDRKVEGVTPVKYAKASPEIGSILHLAGNGDTGNGKTGPSKQDKKVRAATNTLDSLTDLHITFAFDDPSSDKATELEGIPGPGDSGGPAYIRENGELILVGISSIELAETAEEEGHYGVRNFYPNVSLFADWIEATIQGKDYYKTTMEGKELVLIKEETQRGTEVSLTIDGNEATSEDFQKYAKRVSDEFKNLNNQEEAPDENHPQLQFQRYMEQLAKEAGIDDLMGAGGFSLDVKKFVIGEREMSDEIREKAIKKFEELFGQPLGNNRINVRPTNN